MKIGICSLGCSKNLVDTQNIMTSLKASGHTFTNDPKEADVIVVNTCGFITDAKQESIDTILQMADYKETGKLKYLVATGCLVQRYEEELKQEIPEVDLWIPLKQYYKLDETLNDFLRTETIVPKQTVLATSDYAAYLKIADGCSNYCSFCAIPLIRGHYKSEKFEDVLAQAKELEQMGIKELTLIAQDSTKYGIDLYHKLRLKDLLVELNKMDFKWIRILYMYPDEMDEELLDTMAKCEKVLPYFDIPTQHANNRILKLMNRKSSKEHTREIVELIKQKFENPTLRTSLIVGFPTETQEEFEELMDYVSEIKWDRMGAFTYSAEEGTKSYELEGRVNEFVAKKRLDQLMQLQRSIAEENNQKFVGQKLEVLVESRDGLDATLYEGRSAHNAPDGVDGHVRFTSDKELNPGDFVNVEITDVNVYDLFGKEV